MISPPTGTPNNDWLNAIELFINTINQFLERQSTWSEADLYFPNRLLSSSYTAFFWMTHMLSPLVWNLINGGAPMADEGFKRKLSGAVNDSIKNKLSLGYESIAEHTVLNQDIRETR